MRNFTADFKNKTILIVGDLILDEYVFGNSTRMSPESPTAPIVLVKNRKYMLGGAANVANNIVSFGAKAVLMGCVGDDLNGSVLKELAKPTKIDSRLITSGYRPTTIKTRVFDGERYIARVDTETTRPFNREELRSFSKELGRLPRDIDFIIISDYAKGLLSKDTMQMILQRFDGKHVLADPKPVHKSLLRGLNVITPNLKEFLTMTGGKLKNKGDITKAAVQLTKELGTSLLVTMGHEGMLLCDKNNLAIHRTAVPKFKAVDVTGAGDVATAACALALASNASPVEAAEFANRAASFSVTKFGTSTVTLREMSRN